jgi:hypothetical protein
LWIGKYFCNDVYRNYGTRWISEKNIVEKAINGIIHDDALTDADRINLLQNNLIYKHGEKYKLNFPVLKRNEFDAFFNCFYNLGKVFDDVLTEIVTDIHKNFKAFVPKRLDNQINVWVKYYSYNIIGFVAEELIKRGVLEIPCDGKPLINGVLCIKNNGDLKI